MTNLSRRSALKLGAGLAATAVAGPVESGSPLDKPMLKTVGYGDVVLLEGPMQRQFHAQHMTLLALDEDALLKPFRQAAGLAAPGDDLGGWYSASPGFNPPSDMHGFIPGHSFGQYLSGLARAHAATGDDATKQKVQRLVAGFAPTITPHLYDGYPLPAYLFDKINIGLIDAHAFAGSENALGVLNSALDAALPHLPEKALTRPEMAARPHPNLAFTWDESYTLPENLYLAWQRGAGDRFRPLAARFLLDRDYFDPLARGENVLPGRHAYSHVNALCSAMQAFLVDGDAKYFRAAKNGFDFVLDQSFATGGWGPNEGFVVPGSGALGDSLNTTHAGFETPCGAYGHFKAAHYLLRVTGDSRYGDSMERVLYNTVLGALPMKPDGTAFYYADYNVSGSKTYFEYKCPCCSGTLGQIVADYGISAYFVDTQGVAVNLYAPSLMRWQQNGRSVSLRQTTSYPLDHEINIEVQTATPETLSVALRIPAWAGPSTTVAVNDRRLDAPIVPGRFHDIKRTWSNGDRITLVLDMPLHLEPVDDKHPDQLAIMQGPLALFAVGERFLPFRRRDLSSIRQIAARSSEWQVTTSDGVQSFKPYFAIERETTRLYQPVSG
jgi:DUF1680 family protein